MAFAENVPIIHEGDAQNVTRELSICTTAPKDILMILSERYLRTSADAEEICRMAMCFQGSGEL